MHQRIDQYLIALFIDTGALRCSNQLDAMFIYVVVVQCSALVADQTEEAAQRKLKHLQQLHDDSFDMLHRALYGKDCWNSNGNCSWMQRLWPLQDFRYGRTISVKYADRTVVSCCSQDYINLTNDQRLLPYLRLWARTITSEADHENFGGRYLMMSNSVFTVERRQFDGCQTKLSPSYIRRNRRSGAIDARLQVGSEARESCTRYKDVEFAVDADHKTHVSYV